MLRVLTQGQAAVWRIGLVLYLLVPVAAWSADPVKSRHYYAITLLSMLKPIQAGDLPDRGLLEQYHVYTSRFSKDGQVWFRLRLGFFESVDEARSVLDRLRFRYRDAWINEINDREYSRAVRNRITADPATEPAPVLEQARQALTRGDPATAITLVQKLLLEASAMAEKGQQTQTGPVREALELLGVSQERLGDQRAAMATYKDYLARYREGEDVERVRQRLTVLQTATAAAPRAMAEFKQQPESTQWGGSFSQFSNRDIRLLDGGGHEVSSMLFNNLDISSRYQSEAVDIRTQLDTSYRYRFNADNSTDNQLRLSSMFVDIREKRFLTGARLGRQSASTGGVLGRFDGAWLSYRARPRWKYNLVAGYPVELSSSNSVNETDRNFVGMSLEMGTFADVWDLSAFGITQTINGMTDRQALGGEIRYSDRNQSHLVLLDYDTSYRTLNSFLVLSNWFLPSQTSINIVLDSRTVPILTTSNALIGRTELGMNELLAVLSEDETRQLARDRTSRSYSATLGISHPFSERFQLNGDVTAFNQTNTPASGGVAAVDNGGNQFTYSLTMIGSDIFKQGDISIAGLRYADTVTAAISSLNVNVRYPLTNAWRAGPAMVIDYRNGKDGFNQLTVKPSLRIDYRWLNNISIDAELAVLHIKDIGSGLGSNTDVFFELGYRIDF